MPTYAVLLQYEVVSAVVVEAESEEEAARLANEFESRAHEGVEDDDRVRVSSRLWGEGSLEIAEAEDDEDAEELLEDWIDAIEEELDEEDLDNDIDEEEAADEETADDENEADEAVEDGEQAGPGNERRP